MSNKRSRNHHYVPKALQRYFSENQKNIWYSEIDESGDYSSPEYRNINSTFKEFDFYTVLDGEGRPTDKVEKEFYSVIDDYLGALLQEINSLFNSGFTPIFKGEQLSSLHHLVLNLASRTPYLAGGGKFNDVEIGRTYAIDVIEALERKAMDHLEISRFQSMLNDQRSLDIRGKNIRVRGQARLKNGAIAALSDFVVRWAVSSGKHTFILQGSVIHRIGNGVSNGLSSPSCEWWMPISPKRALILLRDPENRVPLVYRISRDHMRKINESAALNRRNLASPSRKLLESLTQRKIY